jgi:hypothetical protein
VREVCSFDYAVVRVVPRVERGEFLNVGVILFCSTRSFLAARIELDRERLLAIAPSSDIASIESHLQTIPVVCAGGPAAGPVGELSQGERFQGRIAPRSTVIQVSPLHAGVHDDVEAALDRLFEKLVRTPS